MTLPFLAIVSSFIKSVLVTRTPTAGQGGTGADPLLTFTNVPFGDAYTGRMIVACIAVGASNGSPASLSVSSATIGGVSATTARFAYARDGNNSNASFIIYAIVPTGTTGTIVVNLNTNPGGGQGQACTAYAIDSRTLNSTTPTFTGSATTTTGASLSVNSVPFVPGNFVVGSLTYDGTGDTSTLTNITKNSYVTFESSQRSLTAGSIVNNSASTTKTVSASVPSGGQRMAFAVACWR